MRKKLKKLIKILKRNIIFLLSHFIKKDENIWVFGAYMGKNYTDNSKYLYEYINANTDIQAVWLTKNKKVIKELRELGLPVYSMFSKKGRYYAMRAKVAFYTHRSIVNFDLPFYAFTKKTKLVLLWHGIPLKKIGFDDKIFSFKDDEKSLKYKVKRIIKEKVFTFTNYAHKPDIVLALSTTSKKLFSQAFRVQDSKVLITGYPRNDVFFKVNKVVKSKHEKKHAIYMPTFRGKGDDFDLFMQYDFDIEKFDHFLETEGVRLYIKLHPFNNPTEDLLRKIMFSDNIRFLNYKAIYEVINDFDILITDYSSIYFDFLLSKKPIIFTPFDKKEYIEGHRELYFEYDEVTPGPKAMNWTEVMTYIHKFNQNPEFFQDERTKISNMFHLYKDGNSSKRVYEVILNLLSKEKV